MLKQKLIKARKHKKFSQQDIAKHLNISQTHYLRKEKGEVIIYDEEWERIAKLLDIEVNNIKELDKENITEGFLGNNKIYCNVPEFILENQQDYISILKKEIENLKAKISELEKK